MQQALVRMQAQQAQIAAQYENFRHALENLNLERHDSAPPPAPNAAVPSSSMLPTSAQQPFSHPNPSALPSNTAHYRAHGPTTQFAPHTSNPRTALPNPQFNHPPPHFDPSYSYQPYNTNTCEYTLQNASKHASQYFKNNRFQGIVSEASAETAEELQQYVIDVYNLTDTEALPVVSFTIKGEEHKHYNKYVVPVAQGFCEASALMSERFDTVAKLRRVLNYLQSLRISDFFDGSTSINEAFCKLTAEIQAHFERIPNDFRGEHLKRKLLIASLEGQDWCAIECNRPSTTYPTF
ncbi:hypothetical protein FGB62_12g03 [Gracilaria domingensis]|nr:hypothetical protein FGB62_12g03 [Gracilaria domingensis]